MTVSDEASQYYGIPEGVLVSEVQKAVQLRMPEFKGKNPSLQNSMAREYAASMNW